MAKNIVKAMQERGVKRIIAISSIGIYNKPLRPLLIPYRKLADIIEASGLDFSIMIEVAEFHLFIDPINIVGMNIKPVVKLHQMLFIVTFVKWLQPFHPLIHFHARTVHIIGRTADRVERILTTNSNCCNYFQHSQKR